MILKGGQDLWIRAVPKPHRDSLQCLLQSPLRRMAQRDALEHGYRDGISRGLDGIDVADATHHSKPGEPMLRPYHH